jgi:hypothetical protein
MAGGAKLPRNASTDGHAVAQTEADPGVRSASGLKSKKRQTDPADRKGQGN